ncbi:MAG: hypothetical protein RSC21_06690, partial [Cetobacterium sp.]
MKQKYLLLTALAIVISSTTALSEEKENVGIHLEETIISSESFGTKLLEIPKNVTIITAGDIER